MNFSKRNVNRYFSFLILRNADFYKEGNANITAYGEYLNYDLNGNILQLNRTMGDANDNSIEMDKLEYTYEFGNTNSNRLKKVIDNAAQGTSSGFSNGASGNSDDYTYDLNGNMTSDKNKGITSIDYNHLNLPTKIKFNNSENQKIEYLYNASGVKVKKKVTDGSNIKEVDYLDGFQYAGSVLQFFPHPEGYVKATAATPTNTSYYYDYVYPVK
ncbi:MAG TPA: hypothetical protein VKZ42_05090 [Flavobacteriaceae bacterium]|nr:hypothetical protein [Flavobacteriaceae bacterium]